MFKPSSDEGELPQGCTRKLNTPLVAESLSELVSGSVCGLESQRSTLNGGLPKPQPQTQAQIWPGDDHQITFDHPLDLRHRYHCFSHYLNRLEETIPRTYNVVCYIIFPLIMLIVLSFAFGYGLTRLEAPGEMRSNNGHMEAAYMVKGGLYEIFHSMDDDYESCLLKFQEESLTSHGLVEFIHECLKEPKEERMEIFVNASEMIILDELTNDMTYNWITCANETTDIFDRDEQISYVRNVWSESYNNLRSKYEGEGLSESEAFKKAVSEADGTKNCVANHVGGAFFWFTIMTTIGYGNTSPVTNAGRLMVYVFGFLSIILFSGAIGHAGYIILTIVDDFFFCVGLRKFTEGVKSVLFWFVMMVLWIFVSAWLYIGYVTIGGGERSSFLTDACWFAFISVTTVGFGDFYVAHDSIRVYDMIWMPFTLLIGFILLANFLIKLTDMVKDALASRSRKLTIKLKSLYIPRSEVDEELKSSKDDLANGKNLDESSLERKTDDNLPDETTHDNILPKHEPADGDDIDDFNFEIKQ